MQVKRGASSGAQWYQNPLGATSRGLNLQSIRLIHAVRESRRADSNRFTTHYECAVSGCWALQGFANTA
jgi:hypothetical protein